ncbi:MAG: cysteine desulfurase [Solobacterium sp.]|nr:cysteine desulfurase [Solobacterium sp.]
MFDVNEIRKDFPMLVNRSDLVYFDNAATTYKPKQVIDAVTGFYTGYTSNVERGDYETAVRADRAYDNTRSVIARLINCEPREVAFLSNVTEVLNQIAYSLGRDLKEGDVILTSKAEHASNLLPWFRLAKEKGVKVEYVPVDAQGVCHIEDFRNALHEGVKIVSLAMVTNVLGSLQPIREITEAAHAAGAVMVVDGAQSVPHMPVDVKDLDIDFLGFSSHKMCGPDGVGVLYGKYEHLAKMEPLCLGGGMNARYHSDGSVILKDAPIRFEAGTPNIEGVIGLGAAAEYLMSVGMENIRAYEADLRAYIAAGIRKMDHIQFFNPDNLNGPVTFNARDVFAQDAAGYLGSKKICVRSGNHCAKILHEVIGTDQTVRASLYFYNTKEEADRFLEACEGITLENAIGIFF